MSRCTMMPCNAKTPAPTVACAVPMASFRLMLGHACTEGSDTGIFPDFAEYVKPSQDKYLYTRALPSPI